MRSTVEETQDLMAALKARCKAMGLTQGQLATKLGISLPTVKRWFSGHGVGLENLFQLLKILDISLDDIVSVLPQVKAKTFNYTLEQEDFFADQPEFLSYFDQLIQGKSPTQIERSFKISARATRKYLKQLEAIGLIEVHANDKVKLLVQGEPAWRQNGRLALVLRARAVTEFVQAAAVKSDELSLFLHGYTAADLSELRQEIGVLMQKAQSLHRRSTILDDQTKPYGLMIGLAPFKWSVLNHVIEI